MVEQTGEFGEERIETFEEDGTTQTDGLAEAAPDEWLDRVASHTVVLVGRTHLLSDSFLSSLAKKAKEEDLRQLRVVGGVAVRTQNRGLAFCRRTGICVEPFQVLGGGEKTGLLRRLRRGRETKPRVTALREHRMVDFVERASRTRPVVVIGQSSEPVDGMVSFGIGCDYIRDVVVECAGTEGVSAFLEAVPGMPKTGGLMGLEELGRRGVTFSRGQAVLPQAFPARGAIAERPLVSKAIEILSYETGKPLYLEQGSICSEMAETIVRDGVWEGWGSADLLSPFHRAMFETGRVQGFVGGDGRIVEGEMVGTHALGDQAFYDWLDGRDNLVLASSRDVFNSGRFRGSVVVSQIRNLDFHLRSVCSDQDAFNASGPGLLSIALKGIAEDERGVFVGCLNDVEIDRWGRATPTFAPKARWRGCTRAAFAEICPYALGRFYVVTPYGVVDLAGKLPGEAVRALIDIATPDLRGPLRKAFEQFA